MQNYRDLLVEYIKAAGQELIDLAESMVDKDLKHISDFSISIDFKQEFGSVPEISWTTSVVSKNAFDKYIEKGE